MEGLRGERTVVDDAGSSGDAALVLVARTHARNTAAVSLPKEGREWVGGGERLRGPILTPGWDCGGVHRRASVCCWHAACVLASLQALWRALARGRSGGTAMQRVFRKRLTGLV